MCWKSKITYKCKICRNFFRVFLGRWSWIRQQNLDSKVANYWNAKFFIERNPMRFLSGRFFCVVIEIFLAWLSIDKIVIFGSNSVQNWICEMISKQISTIFIKSILGRWLGISLQNFDSMLIKWRSGYFWSQFKKVIYYTNFDEIYYSKVFMKLIINTISRMLLKKINPYSFSQINFALTLEQKWLI